MNKTRFFLLVLSSVLALAIIPTVAAQTEAITEGLSNIWTNLSNFGSQASEYVASHVPEVTAIGAASGVAGGLGVAYKSAASAKTKLQSALTSVTGENGVLAGLKEKAESTLTSVKSQAETEIASYKEQAESATGQLTGLKTELEQAKSKVFDVEKQKTAAFNEIDQLKTQLKTAQDQLKVLTPQVK